MESPQLAGPSHDDGGPSLVNLTKSLSLPPGDSNATRQFYDDWAHNYNRDILQPEVGYTGPMSLAETLRDHASIGGEIVDIGCGTGLGGAALAQLGAKTIDGVDISSGMLREARSTGAYRQLIQASLEEAIPVAEDSYDTVFCVGAIGTGHIGPGAIQEFVRVAKPRGWIIINIYGSPAEQKPYDDEIDRLVKQGVLEITFSETVQEAEGLGTFTKNLALHMAK